MSIARLEAASRALAEIDRELAGWLASVVKKMKRGLPPSMALEVAGPGARRQRDRLIFQAACLLRESGDTWFRVAERLAARVENSRFRDAVASLLAAAGEAYRVPRSQRGIYNVILARLADNENKGAVFSAEGGEHGITETPP